MTIDMGDAIRNLFERLPLFPVPASAQAPSVDQLYFGLIGVAAFFTVAIGAVIILFLIRYRQTASPERSRTDSPNQLSLEIAWTAGPLVIVIALFVWSASVYLRLSTPPAAAMDVYAIGKQWMWKLQHANGKREINTLHVPVGKPVRLVMTSQDVIHSFFIPAFRVKMDVLPGRYTALWFTPTRPGRYHLFCAEYCGTLHSGMVGSVTVLEPTAFEKWLGGLRAEGGTLAERGEALFGTLGCATCHRSDSTARAPALGTLFGSAVRLRGGGTVSADETYLRESILRPSAKIAEGYEALMPSYEGQITEEQVVELVAYIKGLREADDVAGR